MEFRPRLPRDGINVSHNHPLREVLILLLGVMAVGALLVVGGALAVDLLVPHLPPSLEARLFAPVAKAWPEARDQEDVGQQASLGSLTARLTAHWADNPYAFQVRTWADPTPNAFALPGGFIAVTTGLLEQVESENELAFVLAHELGHFYHRHHLRTLGRSLLVSSLFAALGAGGEGRSGTDLLGLATTLATRGFDRNQEMEADRFGLELLHQEYGHIAGSWDFFRRLPAPKSGFERDLAGYVSTHPVNSARIEALQALAREQEWPLEGEIRPFSR